MPSHTYSNSFRFPIHPHPLQLWPLVPLALALSFLPSGPFPTCWSSSWPLRPRLGPRSHSTWALQQSQSPVYHLHTLQTATRLQQWPAPSWLSSFTSYRPLKPPLPSSPLTSQRECPTRTCNLAHTCSSVVRILHYSATISLGFPHFAALFIGFCGVVFFFVRYRVSAQDSSQD